MTDMRRAHERLQAANPVPVDEVADRPDAHTFLASLEAGSQPRRVPQRQWRPVFLAATAAFLLTLMLGGSLSLASLLRSESDVIGLIPSTPTTTVAPTTSTAIPADADEALNAFARTYGSGDVEAYLARGLDWVAATPCSRSAAGGLGAVSTAALLSGRA